MKKKTKYNLIFIVGMSLACFVNCGNIFAIHPAAESIQKNKFFAINQGFPFYFDVKSLGKIGLNTIDDYWITSGTLGIGPMIEWRPLNGIGIQTGLLYSYTLILGMRVDYNGKSLTKEGFPYFIQSGIQQVSAMDWRENSKDSIGMGLSGATFHGLYIPLYLRIYPDKDRQFALYVGGYCLVKLWGAKYIQEIPYIYVNSRQLRNHIVPKGPSGLKSAIFQKNPNELSHVTRWNWDFGFEFRSKSGLIAGANWIGITLGCDFGKLFSKDMNY